MDYHYIVTTHLDKSRSRHFCLGLVRFIVFCLGLLKTFSYQNIYKKGVHTTVKKVVHVTVKKVVHVTVKKVVHVTVKKVVHVTVKKVVCITYIKFNFMIRGLIYGQVKMNVYCIIRSNLCKLLRTFLTYHFLIGFSARNFI
jgi:hypothetical protein